MLSVIVDVVLIGVSFVVLGIVLVMIWRLYKTDIPQLPNSDWLIEQYREVYRTAYSKGVTDGYETVLKLMLGKEVPGGQPYEGEIPDGLREYAWRALAAIDQIRAEENEQRKKAMR